MKKLAPSTSTGIPRFAAFAMKKKAEQEKKAITPGEKQRSLQMSVLILESYSLYNMVYREWCESVNAVYWCVNSPPYGLKSCRGHLSVCSGDGFRLRPCSPGTQQYYTSSMWNPACPAARDHSLKSQILQLPHPVNFRQGALLSKAAQPPLIRFWWSFEQLCNSPTMHTFSLLYT